MHAYFQIRIESVVFQLRRFALAYFHSHGDATGVFRNAFLGIVELTPSGNRVRHIVSSQDYAVAGLMGR